VGLLLRPAAEELRTSGGRDYLRLLPQVAHLARIRTGDPDAPPGQARVLELLHRRLRQADVCDIDERLALTVQMQAAALADRARRIDDESDTGEEVSPCHDRFVELVVAMLTVALAAAA
jgi:hypothetical protein